MIELTDITLLESKGSYEDTCRIMAKESSVLRWMLRSDAFVSNKFAASNYTLHFWNDGKVFIYETDRSVATDSSDEDLRELNMWCEANGWHLHVSDRMLVDRYAFAYWQQAFKGGLVQNDQLDRMEEEEMKRIAVLGVEGEE